MIFEVNEDIYRLFKTTCFNMGVTMKSVMSELLDAWLKENGDPESRFYQAQHFEGFEYDMAIEVLGKILDYNPRDIKHYADFETLLDRLRPYIHDMGGYFDLKDANANVHSLRNFLRIWGLAAAPDGGVIIQPGRKDLAGITGENQYGRILQEIDEHRTHNGWILIPRAREIINEYVNDIE